ncbi:spore coat protein GerQ [Bacillus horti]|uniref:Spore germination protein Q n=1 Tax=Caldalkalibacillus horti TaxID=77523 RepID=A0ABT9W3E8_9BACI|nr:spore coat protein GerQ [Bacillus horti]MDQ0167370.1 spore germination protein Q [Bacillus horti]
MNQPYFNPFVEQEGFYQGGERVNAPQFPQQLQVPTQAGAAIPMQGGYPSGQFPGFGGGTQGRPPVLPLEQSYIENILRLNLGRLATVYTTYEYNSEWNAKIYRGIIDEAGRDHVIIRDPETGRTFLLLMVNLDYVEFDEPINYVSPQLPGFVQSPR